MKKRGATNHHHAKYFRRIMACARRDELSLKGIWIDPYYLFAFENQFFFVR